MKFVDNKYTKWYYAIIDRAKQRKNIAYIEKHHIIPKSLGGGDDSCNLVELTAREHFVCHLLLVRMVNGAHKRKMSYALWLMCNMKNHSQPTRYVPNSTIYETIRKSHSKVVSEKFKGVCHKGELNPFFGKTHSEHSCNLLRVANTGKSNKDSHTKEWSEKVSKAQKGIAKPLITCSVCGISVGGHGNYVRWHGLNCKLNTSI